MQIANYGAGATQMLISFNNWNGGGGVLGIGNQATGNPDFTFGTGVGSYTVKNLQIVVDARVSLAIPAALVSQVWTEGTYSEWLFAR